MEAPPAGLAAPQAAESAQPDEPDPMGGSFAPGDLKLDVVPGTPRRHWRRRSRVRRLLIGVNILVTLSLIASATVYGYVRWRYDQINAVSLPHLVHTPPAISAAGPPETILVVGSDSRANLKPGQANNFGSASQVGGQRSDTIMLIRVDPANGHVLLLSIPRDLYVSIPGTRGKDRINTTFDTGPDLLVRAIHDDLGIDVNHYIEIDFDSFRGIVNAISGIKIYFPTPARDTFSGLNITTSGCYNVNGDMALAYVRARHYEYFEHGRWIYEAESDLARIRRQQDFVRRVINKVVDSSLLDPVRLNGIIGAVVNNLTVDTGLKNNQSDLLRVVRTVKRIGIANLVTLTVPTTPTVIGGGDVLLEKQPDEAHTVSQFLGQTPLPSLPTTTPIGSPAPTLPLPSILPATVRVRVQNGTGTTGQATAASKALAAAGFVVTGTSAATSFNHPRSLVIYGTGGQDRAMLLQASVVGGADLQLDPSVTSGDVTLVTGSTYGGISTPTPVPAAAPAPTTTTSTTTTLPPIPGTPANPPPCG